MSRRTTFIPFCHIAVADEIAITSSLDALELGCLHKIRTYLWIHNFIGLKNDDKFIAKICKITKKTQEDWNSISDSGYFNSLVINNLKVIERNII